MVHELLQERNGGSNPLYQEVIVCLVRPDKVSYEETYWNAHEQNDDTVCVKVMPYDMLDTGLTMNDALEAAIKMNGSSESPICIYHIASVFGPTPDPIQTAKDNVQSAKDVVMTVDKFYQRHPNSKPRLILTSSMAGVRATDQTPLNGEYYTHRDWNTVSKLNEKNWGACYQWSKKESERKAWDLLEQFNEKYAKDGKREIEMIALCPSFVFGPPPPLPYKLKDAITEVANNGSSSFSLTLIRQWLHGETPVQSRLCADVRDVAKAHVAAGKLKKLPEDNADRRYILSTEERLSSESTAQALIRGVERAQKNHPGSINVDMSKITCDNEFTGGAIKIGDREVDTSERLESDLGVVCRPVEETMQDMAEALLFGETF